jgi:hypothetical protein
MNIVMKKFDLLEKALKKTNHNQFWCFPHRVPLLRLLINQLIDSTNLRE